MNRSILRSATVLAAIAAIALSSCKTASSGGGVDGSTIRVGAGAVGSKVGAFAITKNDDMTVELTGVQKASGTWIWYWDPEESTEGYIVFVPSDADAKLLPKLDISAGSEYRLEFTDKALKAKFGAKGGTGTASLTVTKVLLPYKTRGQLASAWVSTVDAITKD